MKISVLGCGWLGLPLAKELLRKDHVVKGSTTSHEKLRNLSSEGIEAFLLLISTEGIQGDIVSFLQGSECLVLNIPPGLRRNPDGNFTGKMQKLIREIEDAEVKRLIFVSSTTVYRDTPEIPIYTEHDKPNGTSEAAEQLLEVEELLLNNDYFEAVILRFGGLFGPGRHPSKYLSGRKNTSNPEAPVNLIHQRDCINVILNIIESGKSGRVFNAVFPEHPMKKNYYPEICTMRGIPPPEFRENAVSEGKIINSINMKELSLRFVKDLYSEEEPMASETGE